MRDSVYSQFRYFEIDLRNEENKFINNYFSADKCCYNECTYGELKVINKLNK